MAKDDFDVDAILKRAGLDPESEERILERDDYGNVPMIPEVPGIEIDDLSDDPHLLGENKKRRYLDAKYGDDPIYRQVQFEERHPILGKISEFIDDFGVNIFGGLCLLGFATALYIGGSAVIKNGENNIARDRALINSPARIHFRVDEEVIERPMGYDPKYTWMNGIESYELKVSGEGYDGLRIIPNSKYHNNNQEGRTINTLEDSVQRGDYISVPREVIQGNQNQKRMEIPLRYIRVEN